MDIIVQAWEVNSSVNMIDIICLAESFNSLKQQIAIVPDHVGTRLELMSRVRAHFFFFGCIWRVIVRCS
jgi:uncharacterized sodium:solute symporter family permease YidK